MYKATKDNTKMTWSEKFSLDVIQSIGMASCKGPNDKTYMVNHISYQNLRYALYRFVLILQQVHLV